MFGKKAKELKLQLDRANAENEELKKRISELEADVQRLKDQEASVVRAISEAGKAASRIEEEADHKRSEMIAEAEKAVETAKENADALRAQADIDAENARREADEYVKAVKTDADKYSENTRTDVNIYVERTIMASQLEVKKRKDVMAELNELLKKTTEYLTAQNNTFIEMLSKVIDESSSETAAAVKEIEKCSCSCEDCQSPCSEYKEPDHEDEPKPAEEAADNEIDSSKLPEEYDSPAQLMQNIYMILKRQLPEKEAQDEPARTEAGKPRIEAQAPSPIAPEERIESELPHDESLSSLVSEVVEGA